MNDVLLLFAQEDTEQAIRLEAALRARGYSVVPTNSYFLELLSLRSWEYMMETMGALRCVVLISRHTQVADLGWMTLSVPSKKPESVCVVWLEPAENCAPEFRSLVYGIFWQIVSYREPETEIAAALERWLGNNWVNMLRAGLEAMEQRWWVWAIWPIIFLAYGLASCLVFNTFVEHVLLEAFIFISTAVTLFAAFYAWHRDSLRTSRKRTTVWNANLEAGSPDESSEIRAARPADSDETPAPPSGPSAPQAAQKDPVHFSVTTAAALQPGQAEEVRVWAHVAAEHSVVLKLARDEHGRKDLIMKSRGPLPTQRGTVFGVQLHVPSAVVQPEEEQLVWEGEIAHTGFTVMLPKDQPVGSVAAMVVFSVQGIPVARLAFAFQVGSDPQENKMTQWATTPPYRSAFASYAEENRAEVLGRIQGMQKALPEMDVFIDVARIRSGQDWQEELGKEIKKRDVLFLFWSRAASKSKWVDWEWRYALEHKGKRGIDPVPIEPPQLVDPPHELCSMQFNDWMLGYMRWEKRER